MAFVYIIVKISIDLLWSSCILPVSKPKVYRLLLCRFVSTAGYVLSCFMISSPPVALLQTCISYQFPLTTAVLTVSMIGCFVIMIEIANVVI